MMFSCKRCRKTKTRRSHNKKLYNNTYAVGASVVSIAASGISGLCAPPCKATATLLAAAI